MSATLLEKGDLKFTPAGIAVLKASVSYQGKVFEAGESRLVTFTATLVALGDAANELAKVSLGTEMEVTGFLANESERKKKLVIHVTQLN